MNFRAWLVAGAASVALAPGLVHAAEPADAPAASAAKSDQLEEIVVTATRREDTINHVALSIQALGAQALEKQEIRSIDDIRREAPGISLIFGNNSDRASTSGDTNISIRGISALAGAATTGIYLDDVPMHKTATIGEGFGAAYPRVFDLERVEVLRGPQGTLFGGSTEGGAVRYITPAPSLTTESARVKVEGSDTEGGAPSYEVGGEVGGPIKTDVLGFRISAWGRHDGGYLDHVSRFTGQTLATDTNSEDAWLVRAAATWKPIANLTITPSYFIQRDRHNDTDHFWLDVPAINAPAVKYANGFVLPAHTYPAYDMFGPGKNGDELINPATGKETASLAPRDEKITVASLAADYNFGFADLKSISSYMSDSVEGVNDNTLLGGSETGTASYPSNEVFTFPDAYYLTQYANHLRRTTEELRLTSNTATPLTWVTGLYYSIDHFRAYQENFDNSEIGLPVERGMTYQQANGFPVWGGPAGNNPAAKAWAEVDFTEEHYAAYGEANYMLTSQLKVTAGVRVSHDDSSIQYILLGGQSSGKATTFANATVADGGLFLGSNKDTPVTPKFSVSYQITDHDMVYFTAARGFRPGGFNAPVQAAIFVQRGLCTPPQLAALPETYGPDTVWNYEIGSKLRFGQMLQLNSSAYRIDWQNIQTQISGPCGSYVANAGVAVSQGADLQAQIRPVAHLTLSANVGYDDAHFTKTTPGLAIGGVATPDLVEKGDILPGVSKWTYNVSANYDFTLFDRRAYVSGDYEFVGGAPRTTGPLTLGYRANIYQGNALHFANLRTGIEVRPKLDVAFYVKNLTNSRDLTQEVGGPSVGALASQSRPLAPQLFAQTFRPREFGISLNYTY